MAKRITYFITFVFFINKVFGQYTSVEITIDDRLLRSEEKQEILNLKNDIKRFFLSTTWDDSYDDLEIPVYIQIIFEGVTE